MSAFMERAAPVVDATIAALSRTGFVEDRVAGTVVLTLSAAILSTMGIHLLPLLQARGLELAVAVGLGAIVGPSQVGARMVEMLIGRHYYPSG